MEFSDLLKDIREEENKILGESKGYKEMFYEQKLSEKTT